ncbi:putative type III secretion protein [Yersinia enterocolitica]|uniref:SctT family type III secretion system export apparatus subunit YscT n=1 Tax=Yersinia enterocolitica TaxID=630 RepID=UPI0005DFF23C|nr:SctT family type III secretion system export apparatus subunit YscT [Yersinia enterocolitica]CNF59994.1 putative type III secretion protein [Yersinia enterocolitica]
MIADLIQRPLLTYTLLLPRFMACFVIFPVLSKQLLGGVLLRNGIVCSLALYVYPAVANQPYIEVDAFTLMLLIGKEFILGLLIGFVATIPFWALESAGFIVDNQRGAAMASLLNPGLDSQTSPTGLLLTQTLITIFFSGGAFLSLLSALFHSYVNWPVASFFPEVSEQWVDFFYNQFSQILLIAAVLAGPLLIAMFLAEFGLALISRFAPSLNVFVLAMPIKSAIASLLLVIYCMQMMSHASKVMLLVMDPISLLIPVLEK